MALGLLFVALTMIVLIAGIVFMAIGGKKNKAYSKILMTARVILQFLAVILLFIIFFFLKKNQ